jgi:hypothetical protein
MSSKLPHPDMIKIQRCFVIKFIFAFMSITLLYTMLDVSILIPIYYCYPIPEIHRKVPFSESSSQVVKFVKDFGDSSRCSG